MSIKLQYNKTFIQQLQRQLSIREKALPTLKSKETALRLEVKKVGIHKANLAEQHAQLLSGMGKSAVLWQEFPGVVKIRKAEIVTKNIAGVKAPALESIELTTPDLFLFNQPGWILPGLQQLKKLVQLKMEMKIADRQFAILSQARKKTTQKVNLYEKVQIPAFREGIMMIKRYLEDQENLSKAAQKIVKERNKMKEEEL